MWSHQWLSPESLSKMKQMTTHTHLYDLKTLFFTKTLFEDMDKNMFYVKKISKLKWHIFREKTKNYQYYNFAHSSIMLIWKTNSFFNLNIKSKNRDCLVHLRELWLPSEWHQQADSFLFDKYCKSIYFQDRNWLHRV